MFEKGSKIVNKIDFWGQGLNNLNYVSLNSRFLLARNRWLLGVSKFRRSRSSFRKDSLISTFNQRKNNLYVNWSLLKNKKLNWKLVLKFSKNEQTCKKGPRRFQQSLWKSWKYNRGFKNLILLKEREIFCKIIGQYKICHQNSWFPVIKNYH